MEINACCNTLYTGFEIGENVKLLRKNGGPDFRYGKADFFFFKYVKLLN